MRKGLTDLRTATTSRLHAKPPLKGTEYLNLYLLDKEAQRLEKEMAGLEQRQRRIQAHLGEIRKAMVKLEETRQDGSSLPQTVAAGDSPARDYQQRTWKTMAVDY